MSLQNLHFTDLKCICHLGQRQHTRQWFVYYLSPTLVELYGFFQQRLKLVFLVSHLKISSQLHFVVIELLKILFSFSQQNDGIVALFATFSSVLSGLWNRRRAGNQTTRQCLCLWWYESWFVHRLTYLWEHQVKTLHSGNFGGSFIHFLNVILFMRYFL